MANAAHRPGKGRERRWPRLPPSRVLAMPTGDGLARAAHATACLPRTKASPRGALGVAAGRQPTPREPQRFCFAVMPLVVRTGHDD